MKGKEIMINLRAVTTTHKILGVLLLCITPMHLQAMDVYLGGSGGVAAFLVKQDSTYNFDRNNTTNSSALQMTDSSSGSSAGFNGDIYAGTMVLQSDSFYATTEINASLILGSTSTSTLDTSTNPIAPTSYANTTYDSKVNFAFGLSFLPGFLISEKTFLYSRLGVQVSHFSATANSSGGNELTDDISSTLLGLRLGLGADHFISDSSFSVRVEADYWYFQSADSNTTSSTGDKLDQEFSPRFITGSLGLTYHFGS